MCLAIWSLRGSITQHDRTAEERKIILVRRIALCTFSRTRAISFDFHGERGRVGERRVFLTWIIFSHSII